MFVRSRSRWLVGLFIVAAIAFSACGGGQQQVPPTSTAQPTKVAEVTKEAQPTPTMKVAETPTVAPTATPVPTKATIAKPTNTPAPTATQAGATPVSSEEEILEDVSEAVSGLEKLKSYRSKMSLSVDGLKAGKVYTSTMDLLGEYNREQQASRLVINFSGSEPMEGIKTPGGTTAFEVVRIGQDTWVRFGEQWIHSQGESATPTEGFALEPGEVVGGLKGLQRVRPDQQVNGIDSRHYRFDEKALEGLETGDIGHLTKYQGEVWIAKDGDFVVKYIVEAEGEGLRFGSDEGVAGKLRIAYEVYDVNKPITIEAPASTGPTLPGFAEGEFPLLEDAEVQISMEGMVAYGTEAAPGDVLKFYQDKLKGLGWEEEGKPTTMGDVVMAQFKKGEYRLSLMASKDEKTGKTNVILTARG
jgi:hypothetical protein